MTPFQSVFALIISLLMKLEIKRLQMSAPQPEEVPESLGEAIKTP